MSWAIAIEQPDAVGPGGRVHAYDVLRLAVPHPLGGRHIVYGDRLWSGAVDGPRCNHCVEIVERYVTDGAAMDVAWTRHRRE